MDSIVRNRPFCRAVGGKVIGAMPNRFRRLFSMTSLAIVFAIGIPSVHAQDKSQDVLSLAAALQLAKDHNGTVKSAYMQVKAGDTVIVQAMSAFYPTINAQYQYNSDRQQFVTSGSNTAFLQTEGGQTTFSSSWTLLDSGERSFALGTARKNRDARKYNARQVLRSTLFSVVQQYYNALRAQELEKVAQTEVNRAQTILDQTQTRIKARDAAQIEELQANADYQNAKVTALTARNTSTNASATLKATIGLNSGAPLPTLQKGETTGHPVPPETLETLIVEGLGKRPDLIAQRNNIQAEQFSKQLADRQAGFAMSLSANYNQQVEPINLSNRTLTFMVSVPLFDAGSRRAQARQIDYNIRADEATLEQAERVVRSDIEAAYKDVLTNGERLEAAQTALEAAQKNYSAAVDSQKAGAYDLLQVITAQLSLVTAESNQIQALYDYRISEINLKLVTGRPIPGE